MSFPRYPAYKDSGVEWLGKVPEHWQIRRLKHACHVFPSNVDKKSNEGEAAVVLCNYTDVYYNDLITAGMNFMTATASFDQIARFTLRAGDTIITKDSETADDIAVAAYVPADLPGVICGYHLSIVRPLPNTDGAFVKRLFDSSYAKSCFAVRANGLTRVGLGQYQLDNIELPFPPYSEQGQIASFLDRETAKIDALIAEQKQLIELLKEKRQAVISHAVTKGLNPHAPMKPSGIEWLGDIPNHWVVTPLKWLTDPKRPIMYGIVLPGPDVGEGVPILKGGNVRPTRMNLQSMARTTAAIEAPYARARLKEGDLVYSIRGSIGDCEPVPPELEGSNITQDVARVAVADGVCASWVRRALLASAIRDDLASGSLGAAVRGINIFDLKRAGIPTPPFDEQVAISKFIGNEITKLEQLSAEAERAVDLLLERRSALISAAVTGQIDVRKAETATTNIGRPYAIGFARQVLAAEILARCYSHSTTGRVKLQKLIHLCEHVAEIDEVNGQYLREAAGPFDNRLMFGVVDGLSKQKWFRELKDGGRTYFRPLEKAGEHAKYLSRWESKRTKIDKVIDLLETATTQQCEIISTLYAAWNDLLIDGGGASDAEIIHEASAPERWHEKKANISPEKWPAALEWMREKGLVPTGFGRHTRRQANQIALS